MNLKSWVVRLCGAAMVILILVLIANAASQVTYASVNPANVTLTGNLQSELGCPGDWNPSCAATHLTYDANDDVWKGTWLVPSGSWEYKGALNDAWDENYGLNAAPNGTNIPLSLVSETTVKFYYDHKTHWITDNHNSVIAIAVGSFQSELGSPGDWNPGNLRSWLQDPDGDGLYTFSTTAIPAGNYEAKVAIDESWTENYGAGGSPGGANIPFTVPGNGARVDFSYDAATHVLNISLGSGIIVVNALSAGGDETFDFTTIGGSELPGSFSITTINGLGTRIFADVEPGTYGITEIAPAGWMLTGATCDAGTPEVFTVTAGEAVTCNFINQRNSQTGANAIGFWLNKNGQTILKSAGSTDGICDLATWLRGFSPFRDLSSTANCAKTAGYVTSILKSANASGSSMNAMLKAQMLSTALNVYFSDPDLGGNALGAPGPIGEFMVDLTWINAPIGSGSYIDVSNAFGGASSMRVLEMLSYAASMSNDGGSLWYSNDKFIQSLAKSAFEAVNKQKASVPVLTNIGFANLQWPPTLTHTVSVVDRTDQVYGQVWIDGLTALPGATPTLRAQLGMGPEGSQPDGNAAWTWVEASFNMDAGNNDEFIASLLPETTGNFDYVFRFNFMGQSEWVYADLNGIITGGEIPDMPGKMTVISSGDVIAPAIPAGLLVAKAGPDAIELAWDPVLSDPSLYGYEVARSFSSGGPYTILARVTAPSYQDQDVEEGVTYYYVVRALDLSFNRSAYSNEASAAAEARTVTLTFNVTVPVETDGTGLSVCLAGILSVLEGSLPDWDPDAVILTRVDSTHWTITLSGKEGITIEYRYTLGTWDHVEKGGTCEEIPNRVLTLNYGASGIQTVNDTVMNWRNVGSCTD